MEVESNSKHTLNERDGKAVSEQTNVFGRIQRPLVVPVSSIRAHSMAAFVHLSRLVEAAKEEFLLRD